MKKQDQTKGPTRRRGSLDARAEKARRVAENPDVAALFATTRERIIRDIERTQLDGSREKEDAALELCRQLQCLTELRREMLRPIAEQQLASGMPSRAGARS